MRKKTGGLESYGVMRHGFKPQIESGPQPLLENSGLTLEQQEEWTNSLKTLKKLGVDEAPGITYESVPIIWRNAQNIYDKLPDSADVILAATNYPRTRLTADLLYKRLSDIIEEKGDKDVAIKLLWQEADEAEKDGAITEVLNFKEQGGKVRKLMEKLREKEEGVYAEEFTEYLDKGVGTTFSDEDEKLRQVVNEDLSSEDSVYRQQGEENVKRQLKSLRGRFKDSKRPVFFYGIGHHPNLITMDVLFNGTRHYDSLEDMPTPLTLWEVDRDKMDEVLEQENEQ